MSAPATTATVRQAREPVRQQAKYTIIPYPTSAPSTCPLGKLNDDSVAYGTWKTGGGRCTTCLSAQSNSSAPASAASHAPNISQPRRQEYTRAKPTPNTAVAGSDPN